MSCCLATTERERLIASLTDLEALLVIAMNTYEELLANEIASYRFDSGEGSQQARRVKASELSKEIEWLDSRIDNIRRKLNGRRIVNINLRRKIGAGRYSRYI